MIAHQMQYELSQKDDTEPVKGQELIGHILPYVVYYACGKECGFFNADQTPSSPTYPYITFDIVTPEVDTTSDWLGDDRQYTCTFQFDAHSDDVYQANRLANKFHEALESEVYKRFFEQANIVVQQITSTANRTVMAEINYDIDFGFDCLFLVTGNKDFKVCDLNLTPSPDSIINHVIANKNGKNEIHADYKEE